MAAVPNCRHCGAGERDLAHLLLRCPHFARHRERVLERIPGSDIMQIPGPLALHGLVPEPSGSTT
eukprot:7309426-Alexandrium_andersonii.AAC.1